MDTSHQNIRKKRKGIRVNNIFRIVLFLYGLLLLAGFYWLHNSEQVAHYFNIAADDLSGFRFIVFLGLLKYCILIAGIMLTTLTPIIMVKEMRNKREKKA